MKKTLYTLLGLCLSTLAFAQWSGTNPIYYNGGNVGIGTNNPSTPLFILGSNPSEGPSIPKVLAVADPSDATKTISLGYDPTFDAGVLTSVDAGTGWKNTLIQPYGGNVGIGRTNPSYKLHVAGDFRASSTISVEKNSNYRVALNGQNDGYIVATNDVNETKFVIHSNGNSFFNGGHVGIGTTSPSNELEVNGTIRSKKVKVEASDWPDYVFTDNYKLPTLAEIEDFIKTNGHLPEVPSAKEVTENGLDIGDMEATLLKKVEEMTLYMIEMKKEIEVLKKENKEFKEKAGN